jgi:hypothetical protein
MGRRPIQVDENDYLGRAEARLQGGSPGPTARGRVGSGFQPAAGLLPGSVFFNGA